jgi:hypothetical protein
MTQQTAETFLLGGGGKSAKFENVGDSVTGTIASPPEVKQQTKMGTGDPLTWDNGDPKMQLVVALQTTLREDGDDDGIRNLYVKGSKKPESQSLHAAVAGAVAAAGAKGLDIGGTLTVTYIGNGVSTTVGFNPPKKYQATYKAPDAAEFLGTAQIAQTPQGAVNTQTGEIQQQAVAAATPPVGPTPEQVAAVRAAGLDPTSVFPGYTG